MADLTQINKLNKVVEAFFKNNPDIQKIAAKELMPEFMKEGVFTSNHRDGLKLRELLRELDRENRLNRIPALHPERKTKNTYWYFVNLNKK
jgi:hypothetical protein